MSIDPGKFILFRYENIDKEEAQRPKEVNTPVLHEPDVSQEIIVEKLDESEEDKEIKPPIVQAPFLGMEHSIHVLSSIGDHRNDQDSIPFLWEGNSVNQDNLSQMPGQAEKYEFLNQKHSNLANDQ